MGATAFKKGQKAGPGRPKGLANKTTILAREALARFVDGNGDRLNGWLDEIAADPKHGPKAAFDAYMSVVEYHVPKLARTEMTGPNGGPLQMQQIEQHIIDPAAG